MGNPGETVVSTTTRSEILSTPQGFYARCIADCPWVGAYRRYQATAEGDATGHDDDPERTSWHNTPKVYNVLASVVHLVSARDRADAISRLHRALRAAGFEVYDGDSDAFESETGTTAWPFPAAGLPR